ncbi:MAG: cytochrome P450 family protein [Chloroflexota bacterium]
MNEEQHDDWNPWDASILEDQHRAYDEMRERCPVAHSEFMGWSLFQHKDITTVLADPETCSNVSRFLAIPNGMDPPVHSRYREALAVFFDQEQIARLEPRAREIAANLLGPMLSCGDAEFINAFATPFALKALCALLGWPEQQWECLGGWTHDSQQAAFSRDQAASKALASLFSEHVKANLDMHRTSPDDVADATAALLGTDVDGVRFDDDQIVSILRNWRAGHGTVAAALGILVLHLAQEHELQGSAAERSVARSRSDRGDSAGGRSARRQLAHHDAGGRDSGPDHSEGREPDADVGRRQSRSSRVRRSECRQDRAEHRRSGPRAGRSISQLHCWESSGLSWRAPLKRHAAYLTNVNQDRAPTPMHHLTRRKR